MSDHPVRRWPLLLIGAPAAVAIWSGWVGLGEMAGFGIVHPLPGIAPHVVVNTAITLPVGLEAYATYALGAWLSPGIPARARRFALWSAVGSLLLGFGGQAAYHLLAAFGLTRAPVPVIVAVSGVPVLALGFAAALAHLMRADGDADSAGHSGHDLARFAAPLVTALAARIAPREATAEHPADDPAPRPEDHPGDRPEPRPDDRPDGYLAERPGETIPERPAEPAQGTPLSVARVRRKGAAKATDAEVRQAIRDLYAGRVAPTPYRLRASLKGSKGSIGDSRARKLLAEVQAEHDLPAAR